MLFFAQKTFGMVCNWNRLGYNVFEVTSQVRLNVWLVWQALVANYLYGSVGLETGWQIINGSPIYQKVCACVCHWIEYSFNGVDIDNEGDLLSNDDRPRKKVDKWKSIWNKLIFGKHLCVLFEQGRCCQWLCWPYVSMIFVIIYVWFTTSII